MGILAAVFALRAEPLDTGDIALIALSSVAYLTASGLGIRAYFCRVWELGPDMPQVWKKMWAQDDDDLLKWKVSVSLWDCYENNRAGQKIKSDALPVILIAVVNQTLLLALALFLVAEGA